MSFDNRDLKSSFKQHYEAYQRNPEITKVTHAVHASIVESTKTGIKLNYEDLLCLAKKHNISA